MSVTIKAAKPFLDSTTKEERALIVSAFREYKETGNLPDIFGRDLQYIWPQSIRDANLRHIHMHDREENSWPLEPIELSRKMPLWKLQRIQMRRCSDIALVYTNGLQDPQCYLLITLFKENAHTLANRTILMSELAEIAEDFRMRY